MTTLNNKQIKHLKSLAHSLKPVVMIGDKGLTRSVTDEINSTLDTHELIKIKIRTEEKEERQAFIEKIVKNTSASIVQKVGHVVTLFKRNKEAKIELPK